ncbi:hypothetical protein [Streptomyces sp. NPDC048659]|uniref:RICIN domain-containing protein n=1 Tax=Streptomyces sp. NPDC048659 TaxID=3155489 RepID=UPI0034336578
MRMRTKITGALTAAGATVLLSLGTAPAAHAAGNVFQYHNARTGLCLDSNAKGDVYTKTCGATNPYQQWERGVQNGQILLRNVQTRRCLWIDPFLPGHLETDPACGNGMLWTELYSGGTYRLVDEYLNLNTGQTSTQAVDSDAKGNAYAKTYGSDNPYQQWTVTSP